MNEELLSVGLAGAIIGAASIIQIVYYVFRMIANWKIFTKAGEAGWKSIIPLYNVFVLYDLVWTKTMAWVGLVLTLAYALATVIVGEGSVLTGIILLVMTVIEWMAFHKLSKAFGHGIGFTIGLICLQPIFLLILGFGSSRYVGNPYRE